MSKEQVASIKENTALKLGEDKAQIFDAHLMMLDDPEIIDRIESKIKDEEINAEYATMFMVARYVSYGFRD